MYLPDKRKHMEISIAGMLQLLFHVYLPSLTGKQERNDPLLSWHSLLHWTILSCETKQYYMNQDILDSLFHIKDYVSHEDCKSRKADKIL
jgi:hypothetical protein